MKIELNQIKSKVTRESKQYYPYLILTFVFFLLLWNMEIMRDDIYYFSILEKTDFFSFWKERYQIWSSRNLIESILIIVVHSKIVYALLNAMMVSLLCFSIATILDVTGHQRIWFIILACASYPMIDMAGAGWMATTLNYLWVAALGLYAMIAIKQSLEGKEIKWYQCISYSFSTLYAGNHEQGVVILGIVFGLFMLYMLITKTLYKFCIMQFILCCMSLVYHLISPGNAERKIIETQRHLVEFASWDFIDKLKAGFSTSLYHFVLRPNFVYLSFLFILMIGIMFKGKNRRIKIIVLSMIVFTIFGMFIYPLHSNEIIQLSDSLEKSIRFSNLFMAIGSMLLGTYFIIENKITLVFIWGVLGIGLFTRVIMGFTPNLHVSGNRTYIFMYISMIIATIISYLAIEEGVTNKIKRFIYLVFILLASCSQIISYTRGMM